MDVRSHKYLLLATFCVLVIGLGWIYMHRPEVSEDVPATSTLDVAGTPSPDVTPSRSDAVRSLPSSSTLINAASPASPLSTSPTRGGPGKSLQQSDVAELVDRSIKTLEQTRICSIIGRVRASIAGPHFLSELSAKIEASGSLRECSLHKGIPDPKPVSNVVVTLRGRELGEQRIVTNSDGTFRFDHLPGGAYEVSAAMSVPQLGAERIVTAGSPVTLGRHGDRFKHVDLLLRTDLVTIRGRIADLSGYPVAGAKVTGKQVFNLDPSIVSEEAFPTKEISTVSDSNGGYELHGFEPSDLFSTACYLAGIMRDLDLERVDIRVQAAGFVQRETNVPRVLIVTKTLLDPARSLQNTVLRKAEAEKRELRISDPPSRESSLPASHDNTITDVNITLDRAE